MADNRNDMVMHNATIVHICGQVDLGPMNFFKPIVQILCYSLLRASGERSLADLEFHIFQLLLCLFLSLRVALNALARVGIFDVSDIAPVQALIDGAATIGTLFAPGLFGLLWLTWHGITLSIQMSCCEAALKDVW